MYHFTAQEQATIGEVIEQIEVAMQPAVEQRNVRLEPSDWMRLLLFAPQYLVLLPEESALDREAQALMIEDFSWFIYNTQELLILDGWEHFSPEEAQTEQQAREEKLLAELTCWMEQGRKLEPTIIAGIRSLLQHGDFMGMHLGRLLNWQSPSVLRFYSETLRQLPGSPWMVTDLSTERVMDLLRRMAVLPRSTQQEVGSIMQELRTRLGAYLKKRNLHLTHSELLKLLMLSPCAIVMHRDPAREKHYHAHFHNHPAIEEVATLPLELLDGVQGPPPKHLADFRKLLQTELVYLAAIDNELDAQFVQALRVLLYHNDFLSDLVNLIVQPRTFSIPDVIHQAISAVRYDRDGNEVITALAITEQLTLIGSLNESQKNAAEAVFGELRQLLRPYLDESSTEFSNSELLTLVLFSPSVMVMSSDGELDYDESVMIQRFSNTVHQEQPFRVFDIAGGPPSHKASDLENILRIELARLVKEMPQYEELFVRALRLIIRNRELFEHLMIYRLLGWSELSIPSVILNTLRDIQGHNLEYGRIEDSKIQEVMARITVLTDAERDQVRQMMYTIREQLAPYLRESQMEFRNSELIKLVMFSPNIIVMSRDGKINYDESVIIENYSRSISRDYYFNVLDRQTREGWNRDSNKDITLQVQQEINFLMTHHQTYESQLLAALRTLLAHRYFLEELFQKMMHWPQFSLTHMVLNIIREIQRENWDYGRDEKHLIQELIVRTIGQVVMQDVRQALKSYLVDRYLPLNNAELFTLVILSPMLMVISSDQRVDPFEVEMLTRESQSIHDTLEMFRLLDLGQDAPSHTPQETITLFYNEFKYLSRNIGLYEEQFLEALRIILREKQAIRHFIDPDQLKEGRTLDEAATLEDNIVFLMHYIQRFNQGDNRVEEAKIQHVLTRLDIDFE